MEVIKIEGIKRTTNFSTKEIQKLLELVDKKKKTLLSAKKLTVLHLKRKIMPG